MPRNDSSNEKTVKTMLLKSVNDFWTIDNISMYSNYLNLMILPDGFILEEYRDYFENFLVEVDVEEKYFYSPSLFSEFYYGTPDLDFLILYFAGMSTLFDFNAPKIKILPANSLLDLNKLMIEKRKEVRDSKENPKEYTEFEDIEFIKTVYVERE
jgi:hypothetical protein